MGAQSHSQRIKISIDVSKKDHSLVENYVNYRECHVKNDVLLIYQVLGDLRKLRTPAIVRIF
jgi:addiction module RelE/StbE family toxin